MSASGKCKRILSARYPDVPAKVMKSMMKDISDFIAGKTNKLVSGFPDDINKFVARLKANIELSAAIRADDEANELLSHAENKEYVYRFSSPIRGLMAYMGGLSDQVTGARKNAHARSKNLQGQNVANLERLLGPENFKLMINASDDFNNEIMDAIYNLHVGKHDKLKFSPEAEKIAQAIDQAVADSTAGLNAVGGHVVASPGRTFRLGLDPDKIRNISAEEFSKDMRAAFSQDFKDGLGTDLEGFIEELRIEYISNSNVSSGAWDANTGREISEMNLNLIEGERTGRGPSSPSGQVRYGSGRQHMDIQNKYGRTGETFRAGLLYGLMHDGQTQALYEFFTPNPTRHLRNLVQTIERELREKAVKASSYDLELSKFYNKQADTLKPDPGHTNGLPRKITHLLHQLDGTVRRVDKPWIAAIGGGIRMMNNVSKLGMAAITSVVDLGNVMGEASFQGIGVFTTTGRTLKNAMKFITNDAEIRKFAQYLNQGVDHVRGDAYSRHGGLDDMGEKVTKLARRYFKWNLLTPWNDSMKAGFAVAMANAYGDVAHVAFKDLNSDMRKLMNLFDVDELDWNLFRRYVETGENGAKYLIPDKMTQELSSDSRLLIDYIYNKNRSAYSEFADPGQAKEFIGRDRNLLTRTKRDLDTKFGTMFQDRNDMAVLMPGADVMAHVNHGLPRGSGLGEALRMFFQFKTFLMSQVMGPVKRDIAEGNPSSYMRLAGMMVSMSVLGYASLAMKDVLRGKTPRGFGDNGISDMDPTTEIGRNNMFDIIQASGVFGLYTDFILGEYDSFSGGSALASIMGPTFGQYDNVSALTTGILNGEKKAIKAFNFMMSNMPAGNLFYIRGAMDFLILHKAKEALDPGYLKRLERNMEKSTGQEFFVSPN